MPETGTETQRTRRPGGSTAADQLTRILYILPAATREGGVTFDQLARTLQVDQKAVVRDLTEVTNRAYYLPPGFGSALQIELTGEGVSIFTTGEFKRPMKLSPREALCVGLALRGRAGGDAAVRELLERTATAGATEAGETPVDPADLRHRGSGIRTGVVRALREGVSLEIRYLKPGDPEPTDRTVHPYALAHGEGNWYLLAYCEGSEGVRNFRVDRIVEARATGTPIQVMEGFDPGAFVRGGRVFRGGDEMNVTVRYSPRIARWIAERNAGTWDPEGGFTVAHRVVDPIWLVRHVLQYGPDAEVLEPQEARGWVLEALEG